MPKCLKAAERREKQCPDKEREAELGRILAMEWDHFQQLGVLSQNQHFRLAPEVQEVASPWHKRMADWLRIRLHLTA